MTEAVAETLERLAGLSIVKGYTLIGGTALSIQLKHRLSVDIDLCTWSQNAEPIPTDFIYQQLKKEFGVVKVELQLESQNDFVTNNVKITFFNDALNGPPVFEKQLDYKGIAMADVYGIAGMKATLALNRAKFRDYYDMYCITKEGLSLQDVITSALEFRPYLNVRTIAEILTGKNPCEPEDISILKPKYKVSVQEIREHFFHLFNQQQGRG